MGSKKLKDKRRAQQQQSSNDNDLGNDEEKKNAAKASSVSRHAREKKKSHSDPSQNIHRESHQTSSGNGNGTIHSRMKEYVPKEINQVSQSDNSDESSGATVATPVVITEEDLSHMKTEGITVLKKQSFGKPHPVQLRVSSDETQLLISSAKSAATEADKRGSKSKMTNIALKTVKQLLTDQQERQISIVYTAQANPLNLVLSRDDIQHQKLAPMLYYLIHGRFKPSTKLSMVSENNMGGKCIAGVPQRLYIESRDSLGREFDMQSTDQYRWIVKIVNRDSHKVVQVADELDSESFVFTMTTTGSYEVQTCLSDSTLDSDEIMNESTLTVLATDLDLEQCFIQTEIAEFCAGYTPYFYIIGRDLYGNLRSVDPSYFTVIHRNPLPAASPFTLTKERNGQCKAQTMIAKAGSYTADVYSTHNTSLCIGSVTLTVVPSRLIDYSKSSLIILPGDCTVDGEIVSKKWFNVHLHLYDTYDNFITDADRYARQFVIRVRSDNDSEIRGHDLYSATEVGPTHFQVKVLWGGLCSVSILLRGDFEDNELLRTKISVQSAPGEEQKKEEFLRRMTLEQRSRMEQNIEYEVFSWSFGKRLPSLLNEVISRFAPHLVQMRTDSSTERERVLSVYKKLIMFVHPDRILHSHAPDSEEVLRLNIVFNAIQLAYQRYKGN